MRYHADEISIDALLTSLAYLITHAGVTLEQNEEIVKDAIALSLPYESSHDINELCQQVQLRSEIFEGALHVT